jgi:signal transduction histidine kinase
MIVPTMATIVVGTAGLLDHVQDANNADRARSLAVLSGDAGNLVHQLQDERADAVQLLHASEGQMNRLKDAYSTQADQTDEANSKYRLSRSTLADVPENLRALLNRIEIQLGELPVMRSQIEGRNKIPLSIAERRYRVLITDLLEIRDLSAQITGDTTLADRMRAAAAVATAKEFLSQERVVILQALANRDMSQAVRRDYVATLKGQELALAGFDAVATPDQQELLDRTVTGPEMRQTLLFEGDLDSLRPDQDPTSVVSADEWNSAMVGRSDLLNSVERELNAQAQRAAVELGDRVQRQVLLETGLLLLTLLLGVLFAWLVARSMARSLRDLRQGALAVAQYGLPQAVARLRDPALSTHASPASVALQIAEPLPVRSKDEFGQVTEAFNAVHLEAVRTAAEQAALRSSVATMFVNLARRSQILVDRLIGHLDRLERGEQDPDRLSELFQLDHLATRMRRNDENLLVLAGADSTRIQREPAAFMDVLRAAQSEVEHYTRIEFTVVDQDIEIAAHAVNDLVHLVAELFDNATAFSPPDTAVMIEARRVGDRAVLQVEDRGIGMSPDQYSELNERLATPPMVDVAVSRMMGLVVVARLAARHGVKVELRPAPERGTVAEVLMPSNVLVPRALAGRTQAPTGFPATRPPDMPPQRSLFPPPLALESGPGAPTGWPSPFEDVRPAAAGLPPIPPVGAPTGSYGPFGAPPPPPAPGGYGGPPPAGPGAPSSSGLGAALSGAPPVNGSGSRSMPAWFDLTGATGTPDGPAQATGPDGEPLPQRRPGGQWGQPDEGPADYGRPAPGSPEARLPGAPGGGMAPPAPLRLPGMPGAGAPTSPVGPPSSAARPPAWPPVVGDAPVGQPGEAVPALPESFSASLDMTSEIPRVRGGTPDPAAEPSRYADDMTMELPIFQELESAWFRGSSASPVEEGTPSTEDPWTGEMVGSTARSARGAPDAAMRAAEEVSWRSAADDGWRAAMAATEPEDGGTTDIGLPRRVPMAQLVPGGVETASSVSDRRSPDAVRGLLSAYHRGVQRGRGAHDGSHDEAEPTTTGSQTSGKEHDA